MSRDGRARRSIPTQQPRTTDSIDRARASAKTTRIARPENLRQAPPVRRAPRPATPTTPPPAAPRALFRPSIRPDNEDLLSMTTELEPVSETAVRCRKMDNTLARFAAVHDEIAEEERRRRSKMSRYLPWVAGTDAMDEALTFTGPQKPVGKPTRTRLAAKKIRRTERSSAVGRSALILLAVLAVLALILLIV